MKIGVVALQGAWSLHAEAFEALGAHAFPVRTPEHLTGVDALVLPGGESTTISHLMAQAALFDPIADLLADGVPAFGTCAGMIVLATEILDGRPDQRSFGAVDVAVRRNAFGRQVDSFEAPVHVTGLVGGDFPATFIRAPMVERVGEGVEVLARVGDQPVLCRQGPVLVSAFHPELSDDLRLHQHFLAGS